MTKVRRQIPRALRENISDYPESTTIHGVKYLANCSYPLADRIFWIIIFIMSMSMLSFFVYKIGRTWMDNSISVTDQNKPTQVYEIPFPAVTICPQIKIKKDEFDFSNLAEDIKQFANYSELMDSDFGKKIVMASQICRKAFIKHILPKLEGSKAVETGSGEFPNDWIDMLRVISPSFDEVFETCEIASWNKGEDYWETPSKENCELLFSEVITNEGLCFTFNTISDILRVDSLQTDFRYHNITRGRDGWDPENGYTKAYVYPFKGIVKGSPIGSEGLKFVLNANMSDVTPFCFPANVGYKIALHSPSAYPQTYDNFISLEFGKEYKIAAVPKTIETSDDLRSFMPEDRQCYFNDERKLKYYTFYNEQNCRLECYANYTKYICDGAPFSSPRDSNTSICVLKHKNYGWELPGFIGLLHEHFKVYGSPKGAAEAAAFVNCQCLPECNSIHYDSKILKSNDDFSLELSYTESADENHDLEIVQTTIEIIFNEPVFTGLKRVRMYTFESMLSDFGGLLGLFMGGSVLSLFELIYFLAIRNCFKSKEIEEN